MTNPHVVVQSALSNVILVSTILVARASAQIVYTDAPDAVFVDPTSSSSSTIFSGTGTTELSWSFGSGSLGTVKFDPLDFAATLPQSNISGAQAIASFPGKTFPIGTLTLTNGGFTNNTQQFRLAATLPNSLEFPSPPGSNPMPAGFLATVQAHPTPGDFFSRSITLLPPGGSSSDIVAATSFTLPSSSAYTLEVLGFTNARGGGGGGSSGQASLSDPKMFGTAQTFSRFNNPGSQPGQADIVARIRPPEHIIVLTHGWEKNIFSSDSYLGDLSPIISSSLASNSVDASNVLVHTHLWPEAFQLSYSNALTGTEDAGKRLGTELTNFIANSGYGESRPTIHLIGHSLGTLVNAFTVQELHKNEIPVDLVTLLDTPRQSSVLVIQDIRFENSIKRDVASFDDFFFFATTMPKGSVYHVENFYAPDQRLSVEFGQPIAGTVPCIDGCSGESAEGHNHTTIWEDFYVNRIDTGQWKTPALGSTYSNAEQWQPTTDDIQEAVQFYNSFTSAEAFLIFNAGIGTLEGTSPVISNFQKGLGMVEITADSVTTTSNSPSSFTADIEPERLVGLAFSYSTSSDAAGVIELSFEDDVLWSTVIDDTGVARTDTVYLSTLALLDPGTLTWVYDSDVIGSSVTFSDFSLVLVSNTNVIVPEPTSIYMFAVFGLIAYLAYHLRSKNFSNVNERDKSNH